MRVSAKADYAVRAAAELARAADDGGPVKGERIGQAFDMAKRLGLDVAVEIPGGAAPQVANPIQMSITPPQYRLPPPRLDHDEMKVAT